MTTTISADCPRLIEVALPIREISAESVRDKNIHHAHISHLHPWWARRPLAAARAIIFASLVPDPDDPRCSEEFRCLVDKYLRTDVPSALQSYRAKKGWRPAPDPYKPYPGVPDTARSRLMAFIAKWSPERQQFEAGLRATPPPPAGTLDDRSLAKWETSDPQAVQGREVLRIARALVKAANGGAIPSVLDPFAGGGAIPLEAERLGNQAIANDLNPVAHLVLRATCEFPQKFGRPCARQASDVTPRPKAGSQVQIANVLVHDVEHWATWILTWARERVGYLYPAASDGRSIVGYLWARTAPCSNPSCCGEIPLLRSRLICDKPGKRVALTMKSIS